MLTDILQAFLRKKDLQDIHVSTLKLKPRARSPHTLHSLINTSFSFGSCCLCCILELVKILKTAEPGKILEKVFFEKRKS